MRDSRTHSFLTRLYVIEVLIVIVLLAWYSHRVSQLQSEIANEKLLSLSFSINNYLIDLFSSAENALEYYTKDIEKRDVTNPVTLYKEAAVFHDKELISSLLTENTLAWIDHNDYVSIATKTGVMVNPQINIGYRDYIKAAKLNPKELHLGKEAHGTVTDRQIFPFGMGITNSEGQYLGSLVGSFDIDKFKKEITKFFNNDDRISYALVTEDSKILLSPDFVYISKHQLDLVQSCFDEKKISCTIEETNKFPYNLIYKEQVVASKLGHFPVYLVLTMKYDVWSDSYIKSIERSILDLSIILLSISILAAYVRQSLVKPVIHLSKVAKEISLGAKKIHLKNFKSSELVALGDALRRVIEKQHELYKSNEAMEFMVKAASSANQAKTDFIRNMQHEFRTPLNHILGAASVIKSMDEKSALVEYIEMIEKSSKDLLGHINRIIDFSGLESGKVSLQESQVAVLDLINDSLSKLGAELSINDFKIETKIADEIPDVFVDRLQFIKVLTNILDNCIKFKPGKNPKIIISAWLKNEELYLQIEDNGIGIKSDELELITQSFATGGNILTRLYKGIGLGLSIVQSVLNMHDCALLIESEEKHGTRVIIRIPQNRLM